MNAEFEYLFDVAQEATSRGFSKEIISALVTGAAITRHSAAVRLIAHGTNNGPTGLEMLSMALTGEGCHGSLKETLDENLGAIGSALTAVAEAQVEISRALSASANAIENVSTSLDNLDLTAG